jgi:hypothetical protein
MFHKANQRARQQERSVNDDDAEVRPAMRLCFNPEIRVDAPY